MVIDKLLIEEADFYLLKKSYIFNSSSRAASIILGRSATGPGEWKTVDGITLKHFES